MASYCHRAEVPSANSHKEVTIWPQSCPKGFPKLSSSCFNVVQKLYHVCPKIVSKDRDRDLLSCSEVFRIDVRLMIFFEYICVFTLSRSNQPLYCLGLITHYWSSIHIQIFEHKSLGFSLKSKLIRKKFIHQIASLDKLLCLMAPVCN